MKENNNKKEWKKPEIYDLDAITTNSTTKGGAPDDGGSAPYNKGYPTS